MICTTVTTVCGVWLAYGEPPNLIMKANLHPFLGGTFFLRYCAPIAIASYLVVAGTCASSSRGQRIDLERMDVARRQRRRRPVSAGDPARRGADAGRARRSPCGDPLGQRARRAERLRTGTSLGAALVQEDVPPEIRELLLGHYVERGAGRLARSPLRARCRRETTRARCWPSSAVDDALAAIGADAAPRADHRRAGADAVRRSPDRPRRRPSRCRCSWRRLPDSRSRCWHRRHSEDARAGAARGAARVRGVLLSVPAVPVDHAADAGAGFFDGVQALVATASQTLGQAARRVRAVPRARRSCRPFSTTTSSPTSPRARCTGFDLSLLHLFAMAQIAGYALGGCWTHIGCAQSVVAYAFIQRDVDEHYTPCSGSGDDADHPRDAGADHGADCDRELVVLDRLGPEFALLGMIVS